MVDLRRISRKLFNLQSVLISCYFILSGILIYSLRTVPHNSPVFAQTSVTHAVDITNFSYQPGDITILVGDSIKWTNKDADRHTATSDTGVWNSFTILQGESYEYKFNTPGVYYYHCEFHTAMRAKVTVVARSTQPTQNTAPECVSLSGSPTSGSGRLTVTFTGKGRDQDGIVKRFEYNFGDGESTGVDVPDGSTNKDTFTRISHIYTRPGTYNATVRIKDNSGQGNEWSGVPDSCKVKIDVSGAVIGAAAGVPSPSPSPASSPIPASKELPKSGVDSVWTFAYLLSGFIGMVLSAYGKREAVMDIEHFKDSKLQIMQ